jgi:lycopene cyclase domain-containing protein
VTALLYGTTLVVAISCMALLDARFRLVLWRAEGRGRSALVLGAGVVLFLVWDVAAIALGFYHRGASEAMSGLMLAPELPVEELLFITFLSYLTLVLHGLVGLVLDRVTGTSRVRAAGRTDRRGVGTR